MPFPQKYSDAAEREKEHWFKELDWETVESDDRGILHYRKYRFSAVNWGICEVCRSPEFIYLIGKPSGVYKGCLRCKQLFGPLPTEDERKKPLAKIIDDKIITEEERIDIVERLGWASPYHP